MFTIRCGATWTPGLGPTPGTGTWCHQIGAHSPPKWTHTWPGGCQDAEWTMILERGRIHPDLRRGSLVEIYDCGLRVWLGVITDPQVAGEKFTAIGLGQLLNRVAPVSSVAGTGTTSDVSVAVAQAIGRGWRIIADPAGLPTGAKFAADDTANQLDSIAALLDKIRDTYGDGWAVDEDGILTIAKDPTVPTWVLTPGVPAMAVAADDYFSAVFVRYVSAVTSGQPSAWAIARAPAAGAINEAADTWGPREKLEDITANGVQSASAAAALAAAIYADNAPRPTYTEGRTVTPVELTALGGAPARPSLVRAGQRVRHQGVLDPDGRTDLAASFEWVIGSTEFDAATPDTITINPLGLAPRTFARVTEAQAALAVAAAS